MEESIVVREENEKKGRKLKSKVWDDFTKSKGDDGKQLAFCNYCGGKFDGSSKKGTTHLKNHLESKICRDKRKRDDDGNEDKSTKIRDLATSVVMEEKSSVNDLIKHSFDADGFPTEHWDPSIINTKKVEILQMHQKEKEKLGKFLNKFSCRFSLHMVVVYGHLLLIVHYIDDNWERQMKIISILSSKNYIEETKGSCLDWKIDRNICSIRHDRFMEVADDDKEDIESWFSERGSLPFGFVSDIQGFISEIRSLTYKWEMIKIDGLRECVDYGYKTSSNKIKLERAINKAMTTGKKVIFYDGPHSTWRYEPFEYLEIAMGLKEAFSELEKIDPDFFSINLTNQKWDEATATFQHLKALREFSYSFCWDSCSTIITTVVDILKSFRCHRSADCEVCKNAYKKLLDKIKVYMFLVILDPRFKMDTVQRWYEEIYDSDADSYLEKTIKYFRDVYNEYAKDSGDYQIVDALGRPCKSSTKSELDLYLNDLKVPAVAEFDILTWWRGNAPFYPTLSRMARDYLAIPIQPIHINSTLQNEVRFIKYFSEIDDHVKSAFLFLRGLLYY